MKKINGLPLLAGPLYTPDGTKCDDWWELAEWFRKYEGPLWEAAADHIGTDGRMGTNAGRRLRDQSAAYRAAYEAIRGIAERQIPEEYQ